MKFGIVMLWLFGTAGLLAAQPADPLGPPSAVYYNGKVVTVDSAFTVQQAFAVRDEHFIAVGTNGAMKALAGKGTRLVDLHGRTVIPGLADNHNHLQRAAFYVFRRGMLDMRNVSSRPEMLNRLKEEVSRANAKPGQVLIASGGWDVRSFPTDRTGPTRKELDDISPQNPLIVIRSRNLFYLNTPALQTMGVSRENPSLAGSDVVKNAQGEPTGAIIGAKQLTAIIAKDFAPLTYEENKEAMLKMIGMENEEGLTSIRDLSITPEVMRTYADIRREGKLTIRVSMGLSTNEYGIPSPDAEKLEEMLKPWGVNLGFGDEWLRIDGLAELTGSGNFPPEKFRPLMLVVQKYGWRPGIHLSMEFLLGHPEPDRVPEITQIETALDAYENADRVSSIRPMRWVVEHVPEMTPEQMDKIARLGILVSAQLGPYYDGPEMEKDFGKERADRMNPIRDLLDRKVLVSSGTDWPGRQLNPFTTIYYLVTRKIPDGEIMGPTQKVSREEALRIGTINNAYTTFEEKIKGSIEPGKLADFLVLSGDIMTVPEDQIPAVHPLATFVGGQKVFATADGSSF